MRNKLIMSMMTLLCVIMMSGCMVGPNYSRPDTAVDSGSKFVNQPGGMVEKADIAEIGHWWEDFDDPYINQVVEEAIANNYDLQAAAWRVVESEALLAQSFGAMLPSFSYSAQRTQNKMVPGTDMLRNHEHSISITWVADLFGKLRRGERAAVDDVLAQQANQQALIHSIVAGAVKSRIEIATQQRLADIAARNIASRQQTVDIVERRYNSGLVDSLQLHQARESYYAAAATEPLTKQSLKLAVHSLETLLGQKASTMEVPENTLAEFPTLKPVPVTVPVSLLERRPDVRAAELALAAATERVGVSVAQLFPDLTITLMGGYTGNRYRFTFQEEQQIYSGILGLTAPIWQGGRLREGVKAAKARAEQAAAAYAQTVLDAIREVEDAFVKEMYLIERVDLLQTRVKEALNAESLARDRYSRGLEPLLSVLNAEMQRINAENELAQSVSQLYNARVDLYLALGGDWEIEYDNENVGKIMNF